MKRPNESAPWGFKFKGGEQTGKELSIDVVRHTALKGSYYVFMCRLNLLFVNKSMMLSDI